MRSSLVESLDSAVRSLGRAVSQGIVWTTDAPYRETHGQLDEYARAGVLAVEMQAASLFAFSEAKRFPTGVIAQVTNAVHDAEDTFDKGSHTDEFRLVEAVCRAGIQYLGNRKA